MTELQVELSPGRSITVWTLLQWKYAIKLEAKGLRHSKGSVTAHAKRVLGVTGNRDKILACIQGLLDQYEQYMKEQAKESARIRELTEGAKQ